jgi:hypothetical protein
MRARGAVVHDHVNAHATDDARYWPTFRPRRHVRARRVGHAFDFDGRFYADGYVMRGADGRVVVLTVREFEAIYEPAGRDE